MGDNEKPRRWPTLFVFLLAAAVGVGWFGALSEGHDRGYVAEATPVPGKKNVYYVRLRAGQSSSVFASPGNPWRGMDLCLRWWTGSGADEGNVRVHVRDGESRFHPYPAQKTDGYRIRDAGRQYELTPVRFTAAGKDVDVVFAWYNYDGNCGYRGVTNPPRSEPPKPRPFLERLFDL